VEPDKEGVKVIVRKKMKSGPGDVWMNIKPGKGLFLVTPDRDTDLLVKVTALREQAEAVKAKKLDFEELEKSLERLEAELKAENEEIRLGALNREKDKGIWTVDENGRGSKKIVRIMECDREDKAEKMKISCRPEEGALRLVLTGKKGPEGRAVYDRVLARLKNELPGGGKILESNFDEEEGEMSFKMNLPKAADEGLAEKLAEAAAAEIKK
jgi:hypothetical protein